MQKLLLVFFLILSQTPFAQRGFLYVKKHGFKKVKTFEEGETIQFQTQDHQSIYGTLALVNKDSVNINGNWFAVSIIQKIILKNKTNASPATIKIFLLTTAGVVLSTAGMTLSKWAGFKKALAYSAGVGYGNYLIRFFPKFKRKKYIIGKKYSLQTLDLHF